MVAAVGFVFLLILLIIGVPVGFSLAIAGAVGLYMSSGWDAMNGILQTTPHGSVAHFTLSTIPMFILMAEFINTSGMGAKIFDASYRWIGRVPGGLGIATVMAGTLLGSISGSSTASAATMAKTAVPEMRRLKYKDGVSVAIVACAGTLACMIPPSIILIVYGILTETSVGAMLLAGILPGILTAIGYMVAIVIWAKTSPADIGSAGEMFSMKEKLESLKGVWPMLLLGLMVIVAIYSGAVTPTEAGAVGAFFAFIIIMFMAKRNGKSFMEALSNTAGTTTMIFTIIIGAMIFGYFLTDTRVTQNIISFVGELPVSPYLIMALIVLIYLLLGTILDQLAILFLTLPLTFPIAMSLGFDPIWFGIVVTKTAEIGLVTPPLGMNVFVASSAAGVEPEKTFKGLGRLLLVELILLTLIFMFPAIATWIPSQMK